MRSDSRYIHGFSLIELSIVIAILSVVVTFGLTAAATYLNRSTVDLTRDKLVVVDKAIADFFKIYGRLPCPAVRTTAPTTITYGLEDCAIAVLTGTGTGPGGGVMSGAVPFRALNLPMSSSIDGFYSKINYVVTKNLTVAGGTKASAPVTGRFGSFDTDDTCTEGVVTCPAALAASNLVGMGGIEIRSGILEQPCSTTNCQIVANPTYSFNPPDAVTNAIPNGAAYILFSSGPDRRGAVSQLGAALTTCASATVANNARVDTQNCVQGDVTNAIQNAINAAVIGVATNIPNNVFYDNRYNAGLNLRNYFDDLVIWRTKGQL